MYLLKPHHLSQIGEKVNNLQNKRVYLKFDKPMANIKGIKFFFLKNKKNKKNYFYFFFILIIKKKKEVLIIFYHLNFLRLSMESMRINWKFIVRI